MFFFNILFKCRNVCVNTFRNNDNEVFFDTTLIITAYDTDKELQNKKYVRRKLRELGFKFSEMFGRQIESYFSSNINTYNKTNISRGLNSSIIASTVSAGSSEVSSTVSSEVVSSVVG